MSSSRSLSLNLVQKKPTPESLRVFFSDRKVIATYVVCGSIAIVSLTNIFYQYKGLTNNKRRAGQAGFISFYVAFGLKLAMIPMLIGSISDTVWRGVNITVLGVFLLGAILLSYQTSMYSNFVDYRTNDYLPWPFRSALNPTIYIQLLVVSTLLPIILLPQYLAI